MREMIIDLFAGGGGASEGIRMAMGFGPDLAVNHDQEAIAMHAANHPDTHHLIEDVYSVNPHKAVSGRPVGLLWASPDCTHHSRAKGGKPVSKKIRGLAWVVVKWAKAVRPRVIILENVPEFKEWGPLDKKNQPIKSKKGKTFQLWSNQLRGLGYEVQFRELSACDYGAPTIRKRLFMVARCDGEAIVWPPPTHGPGLLPYRTAAECIDWSIPCHSIFLTKEECKKDGLNIRRPLAEHTLDRIARGLKRYVLDAHEPFIVTCNHSGDHFRGQGLNEPMKTITAARDAHGLVVPYLAGIDHKSSHSGQWSINDPLRTVTLENRFALVAPFLSKYHGQSPSDDRDRCQAITEPVKTIDTSNRFAMVSAFLTKFYGTNIGSGMNESVPTVTATGQHLGQVQAFLMRYNGCGIGQDLKSPMQTVMGKDRFGLVTVAGEKYRIADIGLRMLAPRELARAQGFNDAYALIGTKTSQVAKIGNSVCPPVAKALVAANVKLKELSQKAVG